MIDWLFHFMGFLALTSLSLAGFAVVAIVFMRWLAGTGVGSFQGLARTSEFEIDRMRDDAVSDIFDVARNARLDRHANENPESPRVETW